VGGMKLGGGGTCDGQKRVKKRKESKHCLTDVQVWKEDAARPKGAVGEVRPRPGGSTTTNNRIGSRDGEGFVREKARPRPRTMGGDPRKRIHIITKSKKNGTRCT